MRTSDDNPGVIAPAPLLFAIALAAGFVLDFLLPGIQTGMSGVWRYGLAMLLFAAAGALLIGAFRRFQQADTAVKPWEPTTKIVTHGVYGFTRNPMYLAMTLAYGAVAIAAESIGALVLFVPLVVVVTYGVIIREERYLEAKFNDEYRRYKHSVRRWI